MAVHVLSGKARQQREYAGVNADVDRFAELLRGARHPV